MKGIVVLSCWVLGALQGAILILVPQMMQQGQLDAWMLAIPISFGTFVFVICSRLWGRVFDRLVSQANLLFLVLKFVLLGFALSQFSFLFLFAFTDLKGTSLVVALCLSRIIHGIFCSAVIPLSQLWLSQGDKRGEQLVWANISTNIGRLTVPLLTFVPFDIAYFSLWFVLAVTLAALLLTFFISVRIRNCPGQQGTGNEAVPPLLRHSDLSGPRSIGGSHTEGKRLSFALVWLTAFFVTLFSAQLQFSLGPVLTERLSTAVLAGEMTARLLFAASLSSLFSLFVIYRPLSQSPRVFLVVIGVCLVSGSALFVKQTQLIPAVMLISAALSMAPAWYTALAMHATHSKKAQVSALISQGHTLGNAIGALLAGLLLAFESQYLMYSFLVLMGLILWCWLRLYHSSSPLEDLAVSHKLQG